MPTRPSRQHAALSAVQQVMLDTVPGEYFGRAVQRVSLANAPQVDLHVRYAKPNGPGVRVDFKLVRADTRKCLGQLGCRRHAPGTLVKAPNTRQGACRQVVRRCGVVVELDSQQ